MTEEMNEHNQQHRPYWKQLHHSVAFWIFLFLMLVGIVYYIMTVDFAFAPRPQAKIVPGSQKTL